MGSMKEILGKESPVLREIAKEVPSAEITSEQVRQIVSDMKDALRAQKDGVAIAAPQIGESVRIVVVSHKAFQKQDPGEKEPNTETDDSEKSDMVLINPKIIKQSKKHKWLEEGCLSVRWIYGKTYRAEKTTVRSQDENGKNFTYGGSGLLSQIFQHEIDHLNGILFIDHARKLEELPPKTEVEPSAQ
jgi:peptide deformylase